MGVIRDTHSKRAVCSLKGEKSSEIERTTCRASQGGVSKSRSCCDRRSVCHTLKGGKSCQCFGVIHRGREEGEGNCGIEARCRDVLWHGFSDCLAKSRRR